MSRANAIVIGADLNGLVAACQLAKRGIGVTVLEQSPYVGSIYAAREFLPGYHAAGLALDADFVSWKVCRTLELDDFGLREDRTDDGLMFLAPDGRHVTRYRCPEKTAESFGRRSKRDADAYLAYHRFMERISRKFLTPLHINPLPDITDPDVATMGQLIPHGIKLRSLGRKDMLEILRMLPMCVADYMREWFEDPLICGAMAAGPCVGQNAGPWSPGTNYALAVEQALTGPGVDGGINAVIEALEAGAAKYGVRIITDCPVDHLLIENGRVKGVKTGHGSEHFCDVVLASCDPKKLFLNFIKPGHIAHKTEHRALKYRMKGVQARVDIAVSQQLTMKDKPGEDIPPRMRLAYDVDYVEKAFDATKYRQISQDPVLDIAVSSNVAGTPEGHQVISANVSYVAYDAPWSESEKKALLAKVLNALERHFEPIRDHIVDHRVAGPRDFERDYGLSGGHLLYGDEHIDQMISRPFPECVRYGTPIGGLYTGSGGNHPGGRPTGLPGLLAALTLLDREDLGL